MGRHLYLILALGSRRTYGRWLRQVVGLYVFLFAGRVWAGMPAPVTWVDLASGRLQVISFFIALFLAMTFFFQRLWISLRKSFPSLPYLTYGRALAIVGVWAALFILILTMIAGARELMTPGAWHRSGTKYHLETGY